MVSHTLVLFFCRRKARWYHGAAFRCGWIYRLKCVWVCERFFWGSSCLSLPPAALPKKCTASSGLTGEAHHHDTHSLLQGRCPRVHFWFSSSCFCLVLEQLRAKQAARTFSCWSWCGRSWAREAEASCAVSCVSHLRWCDWETVQGSSVWLSA